jgi:hypothetical protein
MLGGAKIKATLAKRVGGSNNISSSNAAFLEA